MSHRVVITGMGLVSPIGSSVGAFEASLFAGRSGVGPITLFSPGQLPTTIAAEAEWAGDDEGFRDRKIAFAADAAAQAMVQAVACGTRPGGGSGAEAGVSLGVGLELFSLEDMRAFLSDDYALPADVKGRLTFLQTPSDLCVHLLSHRYGMGRPPLTTISACAAGTDAIGVAFDAVRAGRRRWMLAGGTDSMINPLGLGGFCKIKALSVLNDPPEAASRPFDLKRDGFVLGEGAGVLVLERLEDALARGAEVLGELVGYGASFDADAITMPHPEARGAVQSMSRALADAGLEPTAVDLINAHGTSTPKNDVAESMAIRTVFGAHADALAVCATKSMIGHLVSAAGAVEAIATVLCLRRQRLHPTLNLDEPDPRCDLDYVPHVARDARVEVALSNSFGFGGQNATIALRRFVS